jgi:aldehyde dehydrogenase (NAD+)
MAAATISGGTGTKVYKNLIDGEWVESSTGETFENRNPAATDDLVGIFPKSTAADVTGGRARYC